MRYTLALAAGVHTFPDALSGRPEAPSQGAVLGGAVYRSNPSHCHRRYFASRIVRLHTRKQARSLTELYLMIFATVTKQTKLKMFLDIGPFTHEDAIYHRIAD